MISVLTSMLQGAAAIGAASSVSGGSSSISSGAKGLAGLAGALSDIASDITSTFGNLFTGASQGVNLVEVDVFGRNIPNVINQIPSLNINTIQTAQTFIKNNEKTIKQFGDFLEIKELSNLINNTIATNSFFQEALPILKNIKQILGFSILAGGGVTFNFVSFSTKDGKTFGEVNQTSEIPTWASDISSTLGRLGLITWEEVHIKPVNFFTHGTNAAGIVWDGIAKNADINTLLKDINIVFNSFENTLITLQEQIQSILTITNAIIVPGNSVSELLKSGVITLPGIGTDTKTKPNEETLVGAPVVAPLLPGQQSLNLEELMKRILAALGLITITKLKTPKFGGRKRKKKKRKKRRRRPFKKKRNPKNIRMAWVLTNDVSQWISKVTFTFPTLKPITSDDRGTMVFHLKKGGQIRFVRVKRGTFSVIAQVYGTGYRVWSQFWKKRIVNRNVLSWFIKRINAQDRNLAIPQEIKDKKIKYK